MFHGKEKITFAITTQFVKGYGARMGDIGRYPRLTQETLGLDLVLPQMIMQGLVNNGAPEVLIKCRIKLGNAPFT